MWHGSLQRMHFYRISLAHLCSGTNWYCAKGLSATAFHSQCLQYAHTPCYIDYLSYSLAQLYETLLQTGLALKDGASEMYENGKLSTLILSYIQELIKNLGQSDDVDDDRLKGIFDCKWDEWMSQLTSRMKPLKLPNIAIEVESCMFDFFKAQRRLVHYKLVDEYHGRPLRVWGERLELRIRECHIKVIQPWQKKLAFLSTPAKSTFFPIASQNTCATLEFVEAYLENLKTQDINFNPMFVTDLFRLLEEKSRIDVEEFKYTEEYEVELALTACGYAINVFEEMAESFCRKHDPMEYVTFEMKPRFKKLFIDMYNYEVGIFTEKDGQKRS